MKTMAKIILILALITGFNYSEQSLIASNNKEISSVTKQPPWAPAHGKRAKVRYYYIPEIEVYYDIFTDNFVYWTNGTWAFSIGLPPPYVGFNLYTANKIVLDNYYDSPWRYHTVYKTKYPRKGYFKVANAKMKTGPVKSGKRIGTPVKMQKSMPMKNGNMKQSKGKGNNHSAKGGKSGGKGKH